MEKIEINKYKDLNLKLLDKFDNYCQNNAIKYFLGFGTLLGAVRHKGFIPWDDDIDICMFEEDCEKMSKEYSEKGYTYNNCIINKDYFLPFDKFSNKDSLKVEFANIPKSHQIGFNIDIFPIYCFKNVETANKCFNKIKILKKRLMLKLSDVKGHKGIKKIIIFLLHVLEWRNLNSLSKKIVNTIKKYSCSKNENGAVATFISDCYSRRLICFDPTDFNLTHLEFEGKMYPAPSNYDKILKLLYGDYLTPPPLDKQVTHHNFVVYQK